MPIKLFMNRRTVLSVAVIMSGLLVSSFIWAFAQTGTRAARFNVSDGNDVIMDSESLKGKVIVGFYEGRDQIEKNKQLKVVLQKYYFDNLEISSKNVFMLSVIDATPANFITRPVWRKRFIKNSEQNKLTVYGDWDGSMKQAYGLPDDESVFILIDKKGIIRYIYPGKVPEKYFTGIKELIGRLCLE
jgi:predicted transcriptional regulator